jgi:hypothetical protein
LIIAAASLIALAAAAVTSKPFDIGLGMLVFFAAVAVTIAMRRPVGRPLEVGIASDGQLRIREPQAKDSESAFPERPINVTFAAPWLISVRHGTMLIPIWPDSLPDSVFRRLWVHLRWGRVVPSGENLEPSGGRGGDQ